MYFPAPQQYPEYRALEILGPGVTELDWDARILLASILVWRALEPYVGEVIPIIQPTPKERWDMLRGARQYRIQDDYLFRLREVARQAVPPACRVVVEIDSYLADGELKVSTRKPSK
jgi:hypothetical protein